MGAVRTEHRMATVIGLLSLLGGSVSCGAKATSLPSDGASVAGGSTIPDTSAAAGASSRHVTNVLTPLPGPAPSYPCVSPTAVERGPNVALNSGDRAGSRNYPNPQRAFDGDPATDSGEAIDKDGVLALDLGTQLNLAETIVRFSASTPQRYKIQGSLDKRVWSDILRVENPSYVDQRRLPPAAYRYVRFLIYRNPTLAELPSLLSSVSEIQAFQDVGGLGHSTCSFAQYVEPIDRKYWVASTNGGASAQGAVSAPTQGWIDPHGDFDGPDAWLSEQGAVVDSRLVVDLGFVQTFNTLYLSSRGEALQQLAVFTTDDERAWGHPLAIGSIAPTGGSDYAAIVFPTQRSRYLKIESLYSSHHVPWGFWNVTLLNDGFATASGPRPTTIASVRSASPATMPEAEAAFDGDDSTSVSVTDDLVVDLGGAFSVSLMNVKFASIRDAFVYHIETSADGTAWTRQQTLYMARAFPSLVNNLVRANYTTRYLKLVFEPSPAGPINVSEVEAFGASAER